MATTKPLKKKLTQAMVSIWGTIIPRLFFIIPVMAVGSWGMGGREPGGVVGRGERAPVGVHGGLYNRRGGTGEAARREHLLLRGHLGRLLAEEAVLRAMDLQASEKTGLRALLCLKTLSETYAR